LTNILKLKNNNVREGRAHLSEKLQIYHESD